MNQYNYLFKYILVGDSGVGKSCLLMRFVDDRFREDHDATIGVEFGSKTVEIDQYAIKIQIWDTAGQESFRSITRSYYKGSVGAIVTFDISRRKTFESLQEWLEEIQEHGKNNVFTVIIGNKSDKDVHVKVENFQHLIAVWKHVLRREVSEKEGQDFAKQAGSQYFETSAKNGSGIQEAFMHISENILKKILENQIDISNDRCGVKIGRRSIIKPQTHQSIQSDQQRSSESFHSNPMNNSDNEEELTAYKLISHGSSSSNQQNQATCYC